MRTKTSEKRQKELEGRIGEVYALDDEDDMAEYDAEKMTKSQFETEL